MQPFSQRERSKSMTGFRFLDVGGDDLDQVIDQIQEGDPVLTELRNSPRHQLAFRTFACLKAGILLGQQLVERDTQGEDWVAKLLAEPAIYDRLRAEVESVGYQIACDPSLVHERPRQPDPAMRRRFMRMAESLLSGQGPSPTA